jgi:hypothetical protein
VGDGNNWAHWLLWSHGGMLVDKSGKVVVNSPETCAALEYAKQLYATFVPGTLSWQDPSNNKAYLDGQISLTANGISVYYAAKNSTDPKMQEMARISSTRTSRSARRQADRADADHADDGVQAHQVPNAAKAFVQFMMEPDQYNPWMKASIGYVSQPLKAYEKNPIWTDDPSHRTATRPSLMLDNGHAGPLAQASACMADYMVLDMVAEAASGSKTCSRPSRAPSATTRRDRRLDAERRSAGFPRDGQGQVAACRWRAMQAPALYRPPCPGPPSRQIMLSLFLNNRNVLGMLFMAPAVILLVVFLTYPLGLGIWLGFTDTKIGGEGSFVGLDNYTYLAGDSLALLSLFNTVFYTVSASILKFALGLWLAILLNKNVPLKTFFRAIVLCPGSCRLPCRRWLSGGCMTRSSPSSAGRCTRWA